jgi:hypothetical protein
LEWAIATLTIVVIVLNTRPRLFLPTIMREADEIALLVLAPFFAAMAWWRFMSARREGSIPRWRIWISLCGCIALSLAIVVPVFAVGMPDRLIFALPWDFAPVWHVSGAISLLASVLAARKMRFPLVLGGLVVVLIMLLLPSPVL